MFQDILTAALLLWAALTSATENTPYQEEIRTVGMAVAWYESNWQPDATGDYGCSLGYFQFNRCGGMGMPYSPSELLNPGRNAALFSEYVAVHLHAGYEMQDILAPWSVRWKSLALASELSNGTVWDWARYIAEGRM